MVNVHGVRTAKTYRASGLLEQGCNYCNSLLDAKSSDNNRNIQKTNNKNTT